MSLKERLRSTLLGLLSTVLGLVAVALLIEAVLRFLPVNETMRAMPVNEADPVLRYVPNRTTLWSQGPRFCITDTVHANNYGFINDQDYDPKGSGPLVAVVGDSYVEALMVPFARTGQGLLSQELKGRARVYSFAKSGAPLSQYLGYAQWAHAIFRPARLIIVIVGNDYDESLLKYKDSPGFHYFQQRPDGRLELIRRDYTPSIWPGLLDHSKLCMYLLTNLHVLNLKERLLPLLQGKAESYAGQTRAEADPERLTDSRKAVDQALAEFPQRTGLAPKDICFVVDAIRPNLYTPKGRDLAANSYVAQMNAYLMAQARKAGYRVIDMSPVFLTDYTKNGQTFEFTECGDSHWNARGHFLFARAVLESRFLDGLR